MTRSSLRKMNANKAGQFSGADLKSCSQGWGTGGLLKKFRAGPSLKSLDAEPLAIKKDKKRKAESTESNSDDSSDDGKSEVVEEGEEAGQDPSPLQARERDRHPPQQSQSAPHQVRAPQRGSEQEEDQPGSPT